MTAQKLLFIDDDADVRDLYEAMFAEDYQVELAPDAIAGLSVLKAKPDIDMLIVDISMPGFSGFQLMKLVASQHPRISTVPFIFCTGYINPELTKPAMELGAVDVILKPFDYDRLIKYLPSTDLKDAPSRELIESFVTRANQHDRQADVPNIVQTRTQLKNPRYFRFQEDGSTFLLALEKSFSESGEKQHTLELYRHEKPYWRYVYP